MKILIGCDVDPVLPGVLDRAPAWNIWTPLEKIEKLISQMEDDLPPVIWLIRADQSIQFCTGSYSSGYSAKEAMWQQLLANGHEMGWHVHLMSYYAGNGVFRFDPEPPWLEDAHQSLTQHFKVSVTRTGWDYGSNFLLSKLDDLGVKIDFSALPGNISWYHVGGSKLVVDWIGVSQAPYHPARDNYKRSGASSLSLVEIPITQFVNPPVGVAKRIAWRFRNNCYSLSGVTSKTRLLTEDWPDIPNIDQRLWAFYFHPDDLSDVGIRNFVKNIEKLRSLPDAEFVTPSSLNALGLC